MNTQASTVHIVDDDEAFRVALARLLRAAGHRVQTYSCAKDFLDSAIISGPGCVTVDLHMPGTNGLELQDAVAAMENPLPFDQGITSDLGKARRLTYFLIATLRAKA